jgi:hypothetical protein
VRQNATIPVRFPILICTSLAAAIMACIAVYFIYDSISGHGGPAGNILRVGFGLMLLAAGLILLAFVMVYWKSAEQKS